MAYSYTGTVNNKKDYTLGITAGAAVAGAGVGTYYGIKKNLYTNKDGSVKDSFAKTIEENYIKNAEESEQKLYKELNTVAQKIKKIKTPEELQALIDANSEAKKVISTDYHTDKSNLKQCIDNIKKEVESEQQAQRLNKIITKLKWDKKQKEFIEPTETGNPKLFNALKKAKKCVKTKAALKFAAIGAVFTGFVAYITKVLMSKNS